MKSLLNFSLRVILRIFERKETQIVQHNPSIYANVEV